LKENIGWIKICQWVVQYFAPFSRHLLHFCIEWFNLKLVWIR
jgi:hypothetical protein